MAEIMNASGAQEDDRMQDLKDFDKTEAGVKGLVDSGLQKIPKIFVRPAEELAEDLNHKSAQIELVSNGKFRSNKHRVVANRLGPRISVARFFSGPIDMDKVFYGPIEELISEENPPIYKEVLLSDYLMKFIAAGLDENFLVNYFKV
ncbi:1-aminocyclopropane-1-carboxylate oxidase-like protein 1-like [Forsythia ovata]|uniref:1-aminocyclopropane-1-carboxylate oxidase-like protein 1-like n=1 Tax=Forsythia ovata TaxID=205694 RepID=A0ABD1PJ20_9LAMI